MFWFSFFHSVTSRDLHHVIESLSQGLHACNFCKSWLDLQQPLVGHTTGLKRRLPPRRPCGCSVLAWKQLFVPSDAPGASWGCLSCQSPWRPYRLIQGYENPNQGWKGTTVSSGNGRNKYLFSVVCVVFNLPKCFTSHLILPMCPSFMDEEMKSHLVHYQNLSPALSNACRVKPSWDTVNQKHWDCKRCINRELCDTE